MNYQDLENPFCGKFFKFEICRAFILILSAIEVVIFSRYTPSISTFSTLLYVCQV